jgi:hypothetical protein
MAVRNPTGAPAVSPWGARAQARREKPDGRNGMKALMTITAAAALLAGITVASAQGTPGAGEPGQDQRNKSTITDQSGAKTQNAPTPQSGSGTTGAGASGSGMSAPAGQMNRSRDLKEEQREKEGAK